jgi:large subunit ribosomal protein L21
MYAVVQTGGQQYKVAPGDVIIVDRLAGEAGNNIEFTDVLMLDDGKKPQIGAPFVPKAKVIATIIDQARDKKILVFKKKRRQNYRRTKGHRQHISVLRIAEIAGEGISVKAEPVKKKAVETASKETSKPAEKKAAAPKKEAAAPKKETSKPAEKKAAAPKKEAAPKKAAAAKKTAAKETDK